MFCHKFVCTGTYDPACPGTLLPPPANLLASTASLLLDLRQSDMRAIPPLATMDIFAGCGGLSEGMHQTGVVDTRWAIEYNSSAAQAFQMNNPEAKVFINDGSVLLKVMELVKTKCYSLDPKDLPISQAPFRLITSSI